MIIPRTTQLVSHLITRYRHWAVTSVRSLATNSTSTQLNINNALKKKDEEQYFYELIDQPVTTLQGIGPKHADELSSLGLKTIRQLADYKFFHLAKSITILAETEEVNGRPLEGGESTSSSRMNLNKGMDKEFEKYPLQDMIHQPIHALQGLTPAAGDTFQSLGVKTVADLADFKYCKWAEAITIAAKFEETLEK